MQRIANVLQPKSQKLQPKLLIPLQCKGFDLRPAFQKGSGRIPGASGMNPRPIATPCISTKNEKIAVTATLYQNNRDGMAPQTGLEPVTPSVRNIVALSPWSGSIAPCFFLLTSSLRPPPAAGGREPVHSRGTRFKQPRHHRRVL